MLKITEPINSRVYYIPEGDNYPADMCIEGYILENGTSVHYIKDKWVDFNDNEYTPVHVDNEIVGFI